MPTTCVAALNRLLESGADLPSPAALWDRWLWGSPQCLLNEMHLLGLLIARYRALLSYTGCGCFLNVMFPLSNPTLKEFE